MCSGLDWAVGGRCFLEVFVLPHSACHNVPMETVCQQPKASTYTAQRYTLFVPNPSTSPFIPPLLNECQYPQVRLHTSHWRLRWWGNRGIYCLCKHRCDSLTELVLIVWCAGSSPLLTSRFPPTAGIKLRATKNETNGVVKSQETNMVSNACVIVLTVKMSHVCYYKSVSQKSNSIDSVKRLYGFSKWIIS